MTIRSRHEPSAALDDCAHKVIGAAIAVHRTLGPGFLESVYQRAMMLELAACGLGFDREVVMPIFYRNEQIGVSRIDLLVEGELVLELKAVEHLMPIHVAQALSYLRAGALELGLVINFNVDVLRHGIRRVVWTG